MATVGPTLFEPSPSRQTPSTDQLFPVRVHKYTDKPFRGELFKGDVRSAGPEVKYYVAANSVVIGIRKLVTASQSGAKRRAVMSPVHDVIGSIPTGLTAPDVPAVIEQFRVFGVAPDGISQADALSVDENHDSVGRFSVIHHGVATISCPQKLSTNPSLAYESASIGDVVCVDPFITGKYAFRGDPAGSFVPHVRFFKRDQFMNVLAGNGTFGSINGTNAAKVAQATMVGFLLDTGGNRHNEIRVQLAIGAPASMAVTPSLTGGTVPGPPSAGVTRRAQNVIGAIQSRIAVLLRRALNPSAKECLVALGAAVAIGAGVYNSAQLISMATNAFTAISTLVVEYLQQVGVLSAPQNSGFWASVTGLFGSAANGQSWTSWIMGYVTQLFDTAINALSSMDASQLFDFVYNQFSWDTPISAIVALGTGALSAAKLYSFVMKIARWLAGLFGGAYNWAFSGGGPDLLTDEEQADIDFGAGMGNAFNAIDDAFQSDDAAAVDTKKNYHGSAIGMAAAEIATKLNTAVGPIAPHTDPVKAGACTSMMSPHELGYEVDGSVRPNSLVAQVMGHESSTPATSDQQQRALEVVRELAANNQSSSDHEVQIGNVVAKVSDLPTEVVQSHRTFAGDASMVKPLFVERLAPTGITLCPMETAKRPALNQAAVRTMIDYAASMAAKAGIAPHEHENAAHIATVMCSQL